MHAWYALQVKPHKEQLVLELLRLKGIEAFYPTVPVPVRNPRASGQKAYFPGYMFIRADLNRLGAGDFNWMPGALGLLSRGSVPVVVPDRLIRDVRQRIDNFDENGADPVSNLEAAPTRPLPEGNIAPLAVHDLSLPGWQRTKSLLQYLDGD